MPLRHPSHLAWQSPLLLTLILVLGSLGLLNLLMESGFTHATIGALTVSLIFALLVWRMRAGTPFAAITGGILTATLYLGTVTQPSGSWLHTALPGLVTLFALTIAATRFGRRKKEAQHTAESRQGRAASQVAANLGAAALCAIAASSLTNPRWHIAALVALTAALAEATADTLASEIGQVTGGKTILITTGRPAPIGSDGAISLYGTLAGCNAAAIVTLVCAITLNLDLRHSIVAFACGILGLFADSIIGATIEYQPVTLRGYLNNDSVNFLSTAVSAVAAIAAIAASYPFF